MSLESTYAAISTHMLEGLMVHNKLMEVFYFLGLNGYGDFHKKQYLSESKNYAKLAKYYITHHQSLIPVNRVTDPIVPPYDYVSSARVSDLTPDSIRNLIADSFETWVKWESSTKYLLNEQVSELIKMGANADAEFITGFLTDVDDELAEATRIWRALRNTNYDMSYIMDDQKE